MESVQRFHFALSLIKHSPFVEVYMKTCTWCIKFKKVLAIVYPQAARAHDE